MRLTRRGWAVAGVAVVGFLLAAAFGPRALNAVVLPAVIALAAAAVQLRGVDVPAVRRAPPPDGFPGETGTVRLAFETDDPFTGVVSDEVDDGLVAEPTSVETTVGADDVEYRVTYRRRGERTIGPVRLVARDVLGLAETRLEVPARSTVLVYPPVRTLTPAAVADLGDLYDTSRTTERDEFDTLREYERGDPLRDIHWKSTAKRKDLIVKQFAADSEAQPVTIAAGAAAGRRIGGAGSGTGTGTGTGSGAEAGVGTAAASDPDSPVDAMAGAAASVALALLSVGVPVEVSTPDGTIEAAPGSERAVLERLARTGPGRVPVTDADVVIEATEAGTTVRIGDSERAFESLAGERRAAEVTLDEQTRDAGGDDRERQRREPATGGGGPGTGPGGRDGDDEGDRDGGRGGDGDGDGDEDADDDGSGDRDRPVDAGDRESDDSTATTGEPTDGETEATV